MPAPSYDRATALFLDALDRPPAERDAFVDGACRTPAGAPDAGLRAEVRALLDAHDRSGALDVPLVDRRLADPNVGQTVGAWRLTERVGEGGMGAVYRAERVDGAYEQSVALKLLRPGPDAAGLADRLRAERQILARLEHPHIARLYDGGVTAAGLPFLALEYVDGRPLTEATRGLPTDDRVRLVLQVCEAVAYAHARLVVHRDLKPSNVLVTDASPAAAARVKLLDFGIATLVDAEGSGLRTVTGTQLLTPAYAAPEQVTGGAITTATDVYALGVLLYEVLADRRPYDLSGRTAREIEGIVCETPPPPPSEVAPPNRSRALRGDLDTIVMTALAKEPDRRYANARALADDLQRQLDRLPIAARPATVGYRLRSFARRYRTAVAAGAFALLALSAGLAVALWQGHEAARARDRAEQRFEIAQDAARALIYDVHDAVAGLPGSTAAREVIVSRSLDYLDRLADDPAADDALRIDLAEAYFRIGNVLGNPTDGNLGRTTDARVSYRRGLATLGPARPRAVGDTVGAHAESVRGRLHEKLGVVEAHRGQLDTALHHIDLAIAAHERAVAADPGAPNRRTLLATSHINRGDYSGHPFFPNDDRPDLAYDQYQTARSILAAIPPARRDLFALRMLGLTYEREAALLEHAGDLDGALAALQASAEIRRRAAERPDATTDAIRDIGVAHEALARIHRQRRDFDAALAELGRAHAIYRELADADPDNSNARETLAFGELQLAQTYGGPEGPHLGDPARARVHYRRALDLLRPLASADTANTRIRGIVSDAERQLAAVGRHGATRLQ